MINASITKSSLNINSFSHLFVITSLCNLYIYMFVYMSVSQFVIVTRLASIVDINVIRIMKTICVDYAMCEIGWFRALGNVMVIKIGCCNWSLVWTMFTCNLFLYVNHYYFSFIIHFSITIILINYYFYPISKFLHFF